MHEGAQQPVRLQVVDGHAAEEFLVSHRHAGDLDSLLVGVQKRLEHLAAHGAQDGDDDVGDGLPLDEVEQVAAAAQDAGAFDLLPLFLRIVVHKAHEVEGRRVQGADGAQQMLAALAGAHQQHPPHEGRRGEHPHVQPAPGQGEQGDKDQEVQHTSAGQGPGLGSKVHQSIERGPGGGAEEDAADSVAPGTGPAQVVQVDHEDHPGDGQEDEPARPGADEFPGEAQPVQLGPEGQGDERRQPGRPQVPQDEQRPPLPLPQAPGHALWWWSGRDRHPLQDLIRLDLRRLNGHQNPAPWTLWSSGHLRRAHHTANGATRGKAALSPRARMRAF